MLRAAPAVATLGVRDLAGRLLPVLLDETVEAVLAHRRVEIFVGYAHWLLLGVEHRHGIDAPHWQVLLEQIIAHFFAISANRSRTNLAASRGGACDSGRLETPHSFFDTGM